MPVVETAELNVVTGAFSYTGKYITGRLLSMGKRVRTPLGLDLQRTDFLPWLLALVLSPLTPFRFILTHILTQKEDLSPPR